MESAKKCTKSPSQRTLLPLAPIGGPGGVRMHWKSVSATACDAASYRIASYLFDQRTHFDDIDYPSTHYAEHLWTVPNLPGKKFTRKPIFVLTSSSTFSAAEEFAYDLQSLKRLTVVGETTGGGAHVVAPHRIDDHFYIRIPFARFVNPITKKDWEGIGVQPDVKVSAAEALNVAEKLTAGRISKGRRPL